MELWILDNSTPQQERCIWPKDSNTMGISEAKNYYFELRDCEDPDSSVLSIDGQPLRALRNPSPTSARWTWSTGFYAGSVDVRLQVGQRTIIDTDIVLDPDRNKMIRDEYEQMIHEILQDTLKLFSLSPARISLARGHGDDVPPIARLEFLRSRIAEIERSVRAINDHPTRSLRSEHEIVDISKPRNFTATDLQRSYASGGALVQLGTGQPGLKAVRGLLPRKLRIERRVVGNDILEHRAIRGALRQWRSWLLLTGRTLRSEETEDEALSDVRLRWARRCTSMADNIGNLLQLPVFEGLPESSQRMVSTPVMQWVPEYRVFFGLWRDMNLGLARISGDFLQLPVARTFDLYELWAFLRLVRASCQLFSLSGIDSAQLFPVSSGSRVVSIAKGDVSIELLAGVHLHFKRQYREYWLQDGPPRTGSFSRNMIPDYSVTASSDSGESVLVIDAKYRIGDNLNDALADLHMYRDAIVHESSTSVETGAVKGAYLVTPHVQDTSGFTQDWKRNLMPALLFHPQYRDSFKFGALTLRPGMDLGTIQEGLRAVLADAGIEV